MCLPYLQFFACIYLWLPLKLGIWELKQHGHGDIIGNEDWADLHFTGGSSASRGILGEH